MAVQLAEGVLKSRESSSSSTWNNIMVEVSPNVDTETVASNFAAPYNSSNTYNKNDTCIHDNIFYTCKQNGVTGNWNSTKWEVSTAGGVQDKLLSLHDDIGIVIDGKRPSMAVTSGQYVIVRNSTISGITDGLYKANAALSTSTDVTAANLTAVTGGGLNALNDKFMYSGSDISNCNNASIGKCYNITSSTSNRPTNMDWGLLFTFSAVADGASYRGQIAISVGGGFAVRGRNESTWGSWKIIAT